MCGKIDSSNFLITGADIQLIYLKNSNIFLSKFFVIQQNCSIWWFKLHLKRFLYCDVNYFGQSPFSQNLQHTFCSAAKKCHSICLKAPAVRFRVGRIPALFIIQFGVYRISRTFCETSNPYSFTGRVMCYRIFITKLILIKNRLYKHFVFKNITDKVRREFDQK